MNPTGKMNMGNLTLLIGGLALAGLLLYGWTTGQELPLWPALAVVGVNLLAAGKILLDARKNRKQGS